MTFTANSHIFACPTTHSTSSFHITLCIFLSTCLTMTCPVPSRSGHLYSLFVLWFAACMMLFRYCILVLFSHCDKRFLRVRLVQKH
ncbi:hypothetical protein B0O99DRAFT_619062 [Bisporella sp. PMI_857]|nr:hypothetical protein B0O99DRAFT_619062 [Bisporella sp. PMI_857]